MSCQNNVKPAPPSTTSTMTKIKNCLRFMLPSPCSCSCPHTAALNERHDEPRERHEQRHQPDVDDLRPEFERVGLDPQILPHVFQILACFRRRLAKILDFGLLLGRKDCRLIATVLFLQILQLLLSLVETVLEPLDLAEIALLRTRFHVAYDGERPREGRPAS